MSTWDEELAALEDAPLLSGGAHGFRPSQWLSDGTRRYTDEERAAIDVAADLLDRVHVPGKDPEPQWTAELVDREGVVWRLHREGRDGSSRGWSPDGCPELGLRWTSPAMFHAGPFIGPRLRSQEEITDMKARAARRRWDRELGRSGHEEGSRSLNSGTLPPLTETTLPLTEGAMQHGTRSV